MVSRDHDLSVRRQCGLHEVNVATLAELQTRSETLAASRASGVARVSYDGKAVEYCNLAEIDRAIDVLDREIATLEGRSVTRQVRVTTTEGL